MNLVINLFFIYLFFFFFAFYAERWLPKVAGNRFSPVDWVVRVKNFVEIALSRSVS